MYTTTLEGERKNEILGTTNMDIFREIDVRNTQAIETIKCCFEKLRKKNIPNEYITRFGKYLAGSGSITASTLKRLNLQQSKSSKTTLLRLIRDNLDRQDFSTCDVLLEWMDKNNFYTDKKDVEKQDRQYALEHLHTNEKKALSSSECRERLEMFTRSERFIQGHETSDVNSMYQALHRAIDRPGFVSSPAELKTRLTADFLAKHKPGNYVLNVEALIANPTKNWIGFVSHLQQRETPGHPFVLYAAAMRYNFIVHVISVLTLEEYVLYPDQRPTSESQYQHVYLAHMQQKHYVSLIKIKDNAPLTYEELSLKVRKYEQYLPALRTQLDDVTEMKFDLERLLVEREDRLLDMDRHLKALEADNKKLKWKLEEKEDEIDEKNKKIHYLESEMRNRRLESRSQKSDSRTQSRTQTHRAHSQNDQHEVHITEEGAILRKLDQITTSQKIVEEQNKKITEQNERLLSHEAKLALQETKITDHDSKLSKILDILQEKEMVRNSNGSGAEAASIHSGSIHSVHTITSNVSRRSNKSPRQGTIPSIIVKRKTETPGGQSTTSNSQNKRKDTPIVPNSSSNLSKGSLKKSNKTIQSKEMGIPALTMSVSNLSDILEPRIDPSPPPNDTAQKTDNNAETVTGKEIKTETVAGTENKTETVSDEQEERIRNARSVTDLVQ